MTKYPGIALFLIIAISLFLPYSHCHGEQMEPYAGCLLAAANKREIVRAQGYLHTKISARILIIHWAGQHMNHAALIYRLNPEGWMIYDDTFGSRSVYPHMVPRVEFPLAMYAARAAYPTQTVDGAWYLDMRPLAAR
ncbi:MAG: hypothetical protein INR62_02725 [Rhodospirillales bacterium]|nr:hypothetical protein [Acetobacter sp.]